MAKSKRASKAQRDKIKAWHSAKFGAENANSRAAFFKGNRTNANNLREYIQWLRDGQA